MKSIGISQLVRLCQIPLFFFCPAFPRPPWIHDSIGVETRDSTGSGKRYLQVSIHGITYWVPVSVQNVSHSLKSQVCLFFHFRSLSQVHLSLLGRSFRIPVRIKEIPNVSRTLLSVKIKQENVEYESEGILFLDLLLLYPPQSSKCIQTPECLGSEISRRTVLLSTRDCPFL